MKENTLTMEMQLDQLIGLDIIQFTAILLILLVVLEWVFTIIQMMKDKPETRSKVMKMNTS